MSWSARLYLIGNRSVREARGAVLGLCKAISMTRTPCPRGGGAPTSWPSPKKPIASDVVFDVVALPVETPLMQLAARLGKRRISGAADHPPPRGHFNSRGRAARQRNELLRTLSASGKPPSVCAIPRALPDWQLEPCVKAFKASRKTAMKTSRFTMNVRARLIISLARSGP